MSLFDKIQSVLTAPAPVAAPPAPAPFAGVVIEDRDAFIRAMMACGSDGARQGQIYRHMSEQGMNRATLDAAVKILCSATDATLAARFGGIDPEAIMRTAGEWAALSPCKSDGTYTAVDIKTAYPSRY